MTTFTRGPGRSLVALAAVAATAVAGALATPTPATSVPVPGDCAEPFPVADLVAGQAVTGLTVSSGTVPEGFTGEVLGVLNDAIAPDVDMIMMRLTSTEIDRVGGIWQGMSGSPVYASDGRLIGAVAYGLAWGPSPVAGVTPFEQMDDYLSAPAPLVRVPVAAARRIAAETDVAARQAEQGFAQLPIPSGVSGVRAARLTKTRGRAYLDRTTRASGAASGAAVGADAVVAGGNVGISASYGDITIGGVGTVTSVCNDKVVAFGHPAWFFGKTTGALHPADAVYVQEDPVSAPFKAANLGDPVGTFTDDHLTGITGSFGTLPDTFDVTSSVTYGTRSRTGDTAVSMKQANASATFYQVVGNHDRVLDGYIPGSSAATWTINGRRADDTPFTVTMTDRYVSESDITYESVWDIPDMVYMLGRYRGVKLDDLTASSVVTDDTAIWTVSSVEYKRGRTWVPLRGNRAVVLARAGTTLKLRVTLDDDLTTRKIGVNVAIPTKAAGSEGLLQVQGGSEFFTDWYEQRTLSQFLKTAASAPSNDEVVASVFTFGRRSEFQMQATSARQTRVVTGGKEFSIVVE